MPLLLNQNHFSRIVTIPDRTSHLPIQDHFFQKSMQKSYHFPHVGSHTNSDREMDNLHIHIQMSVNNRLPVVFPLAIDHSPSTTLDTAPPHFLHLPFKTISP